MTRKKAKQTEVHETKIQGTNNAAAPVPKQKPIVKVDEGTVHLSAWLNLSKKGQEWIRVKEIVDYKKKGDTEFTHQPISMNIYQLNQLIVALGKLKRELIEKYPHLMR